MMPHDDRLLRPWGAIEAVAPGVTVGRRQRRVMKDERLARYWESGIVVQESVGPDPRWLTKFAKLTQVARLAELQTPMVRVVYLRAPYTLRTQLELIVSCLTEAYGDDAALNRLKKEMLREGRALCAGVASGTSMHRPGLSHPYLKRHCVLERNFVAHCSG